MADKIVHIGFQCPDDIPDELIGYILNDVKLNGLNVEVKKIPFGPFAALEWAVPTAMAVYLLKPYFEGFLQEMGKDHYKTLKHWLKKFVSSSRAIKIQALSSSGSEEKLGKSYSQSLAVSVIIQLKGNQTVKLLFDNDLSETDWNTALNEALDLILKNYKEAPNDALSQIISQFKQVDGARYYAFINKESKKWEFYDDIKLFEIIRKPK